MLLVVKRVKFLVIFLLSPKINFEILALSHPNPAINYVYFPTTHI